MDIKKFDLNKMHMHGKPERNDYLRHPNNIINVLRDEAEGYVRALKKIAPMFKCMTYKTNEGKVAVLALDTPRKRLEYNKHYTGDLSEVCKKYGFIPRPINVLKKYVDYGMMKSQDVEHLYHDLPVDYKLSEDIDDFRDAYRINLEDKDVIVTNFNGYSCMSEEPSVGSFYWYFGVYMLIFYDKKDHYIVGRAVLWKSEKGLHFYKGYVDSKHQVQASKVVEKLCEDGVLTKKDLPYDFVAKINARMQDKTEEEVYEKVKNEIRVPYIDEDLNLSEDKCELSFDGHYETKMTDCDTLENYGQVECEECGRYILEDDAVEIDGDYYCTDCALRCEDCDEWFRPDDDGEYVNGRWICEDCLSEYGYCQQCREYKSNDDMTFAIDKYGDEQDICFDCRDELCQQCHKCGDWYFNNALKNYEGNLYCESCYEECLEKKD